MFHDSWNKATQIFPVDFIFFLSSDYCWKIVNILMYSTTYRIKIISRTKDYRFGLVSLFNGISTLFRLFNAKAILLEEQ